MSDLDKVKKLAPKTLERFRLDGRAALVVGGNKGLGQAMALALAAAGADVCIIGRGPAGLEETSEAVRSLGRRGTHFAADVTDEEQVARMVGFMLDTYSKIDILVNSQGTVELQPTEEFDTVQWQRVMDVNLKSLFLCCKHVGRVMLKQGRGKIINISSVRGFQGRAQDPAYAPSKGAVNQLTHSLAIEWGVKGINVNAIAPVFTRTEMAAPILDDPVKRDWVLSRIPMKRTGELDDLFGPVVFLASRASDFVNGHVLLVDGGWVAA
ncbi:MAG: glucose 1-dehydrogenase [Desulfobacterales bacterium]|nr:MAG: glucose 1-dehydrogenase [Desulfobacterales bacterium]